MLRPTIGNGDTTVPVMECSYKEQKESPVFRLERSSKQFEVNVLFKRA